MVIYFSFNILVYAIRLIKIVCNNITKKKKIFEGDFTLFYGDDNNEWLVYFTNFALHPKFCTSIFCVNKL